jgi:hypothetical protein
VYAGLLAAQGAFYGCAVYGALTHTDRRGPNGLYAPFYFAAMNVAVYRGFVRFVRKQQTVQWEKAQRAAAPSVSS